MGSFAGPRDWGRLLTAMLTPFDSAGRVNYAEVERVAAYLVDQGSQGLVVCGTTGESPTLTEHEKLELLRVILRAVGERAAVVFGAGNYNTAESVQMAQAAEKAGAHGVMAVNPYYNRPGQEGLFAHFTAIAEATSLPVMLYNIFPRSAINLETPTLLRLAERENIVAVKEASGDIKQIVEVAARKPEGFRLYSGDDALTLPMLAVGAHGLVSVAAHVAGPQLRAMIDAWPNDPAEARRRHESALPAIRAVFSAPSPVPVKYALSLRGFDCEAVRLPLVPLSAEQKQVVRAAF